MNILAAFHEQLVIPVVREPDASRLESIVSTLINAQFQIIEITLMSEVAYHVIKKYSALKNIIIGAGTVITAEQTEKAISAGAQFLVSPGCNAAALTLARQKNIPFIPGCLTPTEMMAATAAGHAFVKIYPISAVGGPSYIKLLRGPFPGLQCMVSGGLTLESIREYAPLGVICIGISGQMIAANPTAFLNEIKLVKATDQSI